MKIHPHTSSDYHAIAELRWHLKKDDMRGLMVGVAVAIIVWFQSSQADASARRMMGMMTRVGLETGTSTLDDPRTMAIRK